MVRKYSTAELRSLAGKWLEDKSDKSGILLYDELNHFLNFISVTTSQSEKQHATAYSSREKETAGR